MAKLNSGIVIPKVSLSTLNSNQLDSQKYFLGFDLDNSGRLAKLDNNGNVILIEGGYLVTTTITTSTETLSIDYTYYGVNYAGNVDLELPDPTGIDGFNFIIKDESGNASVYRIRLNPSVGLIDGYSSVDIANNHQALRLVARNNNWWII